MSGRYIKDVFEYNNAPILTCEEFDLVVDGSETAVEFEIQGSMDIITRIVFQLRFSVAALNWDVFAAEAGTLTNGIAFVLEHHDTEQTLLTIKDNGDFYKASSVVSLVKDEAGTPSRILTVYWDVASCIPQGIGLYAGYNFKFVVSEDLTALTSITSLTARLIGFEAHP